MPVIRCQKCGQSYDVPGVIAVRLPNAIATCVSCGEWLSGNKAALLARLMNPDEIKEIDLTPYKIDGDGSSINEAEAPAPIEEPPGDPRSIQVIARGAKESLSRVFTIGEHPLWIGRKGCHVELDEAELSLKHCSISLRGNQLIVRDADSHMGTFLDGQQIDESVIGDGLHILRVGSAIVSIEPTTDMGTYVEPIRSSGAATMDESAVFRKLQEREATAPAPPSKRAILICIDGPLNGQEFEIPPTGLVVGREGHVRVPDEFLSRKHFEVLPDAEGIIRVKDLGSRNGTFLNSLPARDTKVHAGDEIRAGNNRFRIEHR